MRLSSTLRTSIQLSTFFLTTFLVLTCTPVRAQIAPGNTDDFQDLSDAGWSEGMVSPNPPMVIADGGPSGAGDAFLRNLSAGGSGAGSKWVMFNKSGKWTGNYIGGDVTTVEMDVRNLGPANLHIRLAYAGSGGPIATTQSFTLLPDSVWTHLSFSILPDDFTTLQTGGDAASTLSAVTEFRILSSVIPSNQGDAIPVKADVDNIIALQSSAVDILRDDTWNYTWDQSTRSLEISPLHPTETRVIVYNSLGQMIQSAKIMLPGTFQLADQLSGYYVITAGAQFVLPVRL